MILDKYVPSDVFISAGNGYILVKEPLSSNTNLSVGEEISDDLAMLRVFWLNRGSTPVGYYFEAPHPCVVRNGGTGP